MKKLVLLFILLFAVHLGYCQNWRVRTNCFITTSSDLPIRYIEGMSLSGFYSYEVKPKTSVFQLNDVYGGISLITNSWANHLLAKIGITSQIKRWENWSSSADIEIGNGIALFKPKPLYSFDFQSVWYINFHTSKNNVWGLGLGVQYIFTPGYKKYSTINERAPNFHLSLRYAF